MEPIVYIDSRTGQTPAKTPHMSDQIVDLIGHVLSFASGTFLKTWYDRYLNKKAEQKTNEMVWNLENLAEVHRHMERVLERTKATRFLILKGSNGGNVPRPGNDFYVSVIYDVHEEKFAPDLTERYKRIRTDSAYVDMLLSILRDSHVKYLVDEMKPCLLKNLYRSDKLKYFEVYLIAQSKTELFYATISTKDQGEIFEDDDQRVEIDLAINSIRNIFKLYKK